MSIQVNNLQWTGNPDDAGTSAFRRFVAPGQTATPRLIWWLEPDMLNLADLLLTVEGSDVDPVRVEPWEWLHEFGGHYRWGRAGGEAGHVVERQQTGLLRTLRWLT